jgi:prevent-host-death family protein
MDVGIRELKARLSAYVDRAARGEVIRVTDRGVPRAVLMPLPVRDRVEQGLAEGWITRRRDQQPDAAHLVAPPAGPTTSELLDEDRGE